MSNSELLPKIVSLSKRRGFIFQSSEIYGGLKSAYDFGPLGVELKRNIAQAWWRTMVHQREDVVGIDASIMMHPGVWKASGHLAGFSDPLVDCLNCKERFRADKAPKAKIGENVTFIKGGKKGGETSSAPVTRDYICPQCGSPLLSEERQFNLMFRTSIGPVDPLESAINKIQGQSLDKSEIRKIIEDAISPSAIYLRPETAQAMFVQFLNVQQSTSSKIPFGIAQIGKSFRNEVVTEKFIFRSCEFEQMEMEYFVEPGTQKEWHQYWVDQRLNWWKRYSNSTEAFRAREHEKDELAHYSDACYDIEYAFPWGWDELEGVASRTNYDLTKHSEASGSKLSYFDQQKNDPQTGKAGYRYTPYVIEPAAGLNRGVLVFLLDAYTEEKGVDADGNEKTRIFLKLHPALAPIKVAVLPLMKKDGLIDMSRKLVDEFFKAGINAKMDEPQSIGKRYAKHDEIGTPYCITVDPQSLDDNTVTIRDRDTTKQERVSVKDVRSIITDKINW